MIRLRVPLVLAALAAGACAIVWQPVGRPVAVGAPLHEIAAVNAADQAATASVTVNTMFAEAERLAVNRSAVGWVEPSARVALLPRMDGEIVEQWVTEGQTVAAGDPLFRLDDLVLRARVSRSEASLARDRARLAQAEASLARIRTLVSKSAAAPMQLDEMATDVEVVAAEVAASEAQVLIDRAALDHAVVRAPIDGRVGTIDVTVGSAVRQSGDPLLTITRMQPVVVSFALAERDIALLRASMDGEDELERVEVLSGAAGEPLASGRLSFVDSSIDTRSGTILVHALLPNEDGLLWPGQHVRVSVDLGPYQDVTTVPSAVLLPGAGEARLFVVGQDRKAELRRVELIEIRGEQAVIGAGLAAGEKVVVEGQWLLQDEALVTESFAQPILVTEADNRTSRVSR